MKTNYFSLFGAFGIFVLVTAFSGSTFSATDMQYEYQADQIAKRSALRQAEEKAKRIVAEASQRGSYQVQGEINASLTKEQKNFVLKNLPILIQPDFVEGRDNLIPFDFDGTLNPGDNGESYSATKWSEIPAVLDWDYIETGGAISLNFMFFRPKSKGVLSDRPMDTESAVLVFKKEKIGPSSEVGFHTSGLVVIANAHGAPMTACSPQSMANCLPPDFSDVNFGAKFWSVKLESYIQTQARGAQWSVKSGQTISNVHERSLDQLDNRTAIVSEAHTHALSPVTDVDQLVSDIDPRKAVVYIPEGADVSEAKKKFSGARFITYQLRSQELSQIIIPNKKLIVAGTRVTTSEEKKDWDGRPVQIRKDISTEFRDADGEASGANGYWGWGVNSCVKDSKFYPLKNHKDGTRYECVDLENITSKALFGFFSDAEIAEGALKPIRNLWMETLPPEPKKL